MAGDAVTEPIPSNFAQVDVDRMVAALSDVTCERYRQQNKWGEQNLDPFAYGAVLTEEVGEAMKAALHARFGGPEAGNLRAELVQVAAVAVAWIECLDRAKWTWGAHGTCQSEWLMRTCTREALHKGMHVDAHPPQASWKNSAADKKDGIS